MNSPSVLNYEIRPCKFVERRMLLASFARIMGVFKQKYQYIGFGGLSFTDFKLFHKELQIDSMYSIEGGYNEHKLEFNKPYSCIKILHGYSSEMLANIDLTVPSIVWLDYDDVLSMNIFIDIELVLRSIPEGSIYIMSCNRQLRNNDNETYSNDEFIEIFGGLVPFNIEDNCCSDANASQTIKQMIDLKCQKTIKERNELGEELLYKPLYNIKYSENRGARMFTCGGIVLNKNDMDVNLNLDDLQYIATTQPYEINIPNLTFREANHLNQILNVDDKEDDFINKGIVSKKDVERFKQVYRYMPNFYDVRL